MALTPEERRLRIRELEEKNHGAGLHTTLVETCHLCREGTAQPSPAGGDLAALLLVEAAARDLIGTRFYDDDDSSVMSSAFARAWLALQEALALAASTPATVSEPHRHRYGLMPVWTADSARIDSWWWCTDHPAGEWVRIEDDPDAAEAIPAPQPVSEPPPGSHAIVAWSDEPCDRPCGHVGPHRVTAPQPVSDDEVARLAARLLDAWDRVTSIEYRDIAKGTLADPMEDLRALAAGVRLAPPGLDVEP